MARCRNIQYGIINILLDGNKHTINELATRLEVSYKTISRHLDDLSYFYPITTFIGGRNSGGVQLDNTFINKKLFTLEDYKLILKGLETLNNQNFEISKLKEKISNAIRNNYPHANTTAITSERSKNDG